MTKIELSAEEIQVIKQQLNGEFGAFTATLKQQQLITGVADKAIILAKEQNAFNDIGEDLIQWYYDKYKEQQAGENNQ